MKSISPSWVRFVSCLQQRKFIVTSHLGRIVGPWFVFFFFYYFYFLLRFCRSFHPCLPPVSWGSPSSLEGIWVARIKLYIFFSIRHMWIIFILSRDLFQRPSSIFLWSFKPSPFYPSLVGMGWVCEQIRPLTTPFSTRSVYCRVACYPSHGLKKHSPKWNLFACMRAEGTYLYYTSARSWTFFPFEIK